MAKPMGLDVLVAAPVEGDEGMPVEEAPTKSDPAALLDELQMKLDELRGIIGTMG